MSEKRPETTADIVSRSTPVSQAQLRRGQRNRYSVDLSAHMAECDANYHKLIRLFPQLREQAEMDITLPFIRIFGEHADREENPGAEADKQDAAEPGVLFEVVEKGPYTTLLRVCVRSPSGWMTLAAAPDMTIRVYHDAQSAEVVSYHNHNRFHGVYEYPNTRMRQRDEKVQVNRFLGEFLNLCLEHGASSQPIKF